MSQHTGVPPPNRLVDRLGRVPVIGNPAFRIADYRRLWGGAALNHLGIVYKDQGRWDRAKEAYQQSLAIIREFGDRYGEGLALNNLGNVYETQGRWAQAEETLRQSLVIVKQSFAKAPATSLCELKDPAPNVRAPNNRPSTKTPKASVVPPGIE